MKARNVKSYQYADRKFFIGQKLKMKDGTTQTVHSIWAFDRDGDEIATTIDGIEGRRRFASYSPAVLDQQIAA